MKNTLNWSSVQSGASLFMDFELAKPRVETSNSMCLPGTHILTRAWEVHRDLMQQTWHSFPQDQTHSLHGGEQHFYFVMHYRDQDSEILLPVCIVLFGFSITCAPSAIWIFYNLCALCCEIDLQLCMVVSIFMPTLSKLCFFKCDMHFLHHTYMAEWNFGKIFGCNLLV